jgi:hypothetical protein
MVWITSGLIFLLGALIGTVLQLLLQAPVNALLSRLARPFMPKGERSIEGVWKCAYNYPRKDEMETECQVVALRQFGQTVTGKSLSDLRHEQRLMGQFRNGRLFTGTWENLRPEQIWHGAFQFELHNEGDRMKGRWLGFDSEGRIQTGLWVWELVHRRPGLAKGETAANLLSDCTSLRSALGIDSHHMRNLIEKYSQAWISRDPSRLDEIFTMDAIYQENAFKAPHVGLHRIKDYWEERIVRIQQNIEFNLLSLDVTGTNCVAEWEAEFDDVEDGERKLIKEVALIKTRGGKISSIAEYWATKVKHKL